MPSLASQPWANSQTGVSLPVGMKPVLMEGMRTRSCSSWIISLRLGLYLGQQIIDCRHRSLLATAG